MKLGVGLIVIGCVLMFAMLVALAYGIFNEPKSLVNVILGGMLIYVIPSVLLIGLGVWRIVKLKHRNQNPAS